MFVSDSGNFTNTADLVHIRTLTRLWSKEFSDKVFSTPYGIGGGDSALDRELPGRRYSLSRLHG
ncbi:MAG: hypothetical protein LBQ83_01850 [Candidatus Margulisbacteria bacterium]|jgi:hypothetical protein|nr:hypothetical protein [Candidatus Margulisiibacteriota bacterium]